METRKLEAQFKITRECALCGFTTEEQLVVCPEDGSALVTHRPDPLIGTLLAGKFEIECLIGSGGMGNVYRARQQHVERLVAVKVLHTEKLQKREAVLRFQQEARAAASLSHKNIVGFFDFGLTEDNVPYIAMDYIQGRPLFDVLRGGTLSLEQFITVFTQVCDALEHAHDKGIIHRDIKPSNIMLVTADDGTELVKILDFGIAKLLPQHDSKAHVTLTQTGELFGSPQYMSPEQFAGHRLDARSDMYSLGCVMYESLMGRAPVTADSIIELVHKHTSETPAPFKAVRRDVTFPQQLEAVVFKTLEKEPDKRFPSMAALKHNLEFIPKFAQDENVVRAEREARGGDEHSPTPKRPRLRRRTKWAIGLIATALVLGVSSIATLIYAVNPPGDHSIKDALTKVRLSFVQMLEPDNSKRQLDLTEQLRDSYDRQGLTRDALKMADQAVVAVGNAHLEGWRLANALLRRAQLRFQLKERDTQVAFDEALAALRTTARENRKKKDWKANLSAAEPIDKMILELERNTGKGQQALASALLAVADDKRFSGQVEDADPEYQELLGMKAELNAQQKASLADGLLQLADASAVRGREQAETYYKAVIDLRTPKDPAQKPTEDCAKAARALGLYYKNHDQITHAEATLMDALAMAQAAGGEHSPLVVSLYDDLGEVYRAEKEFDKATEMFKLAERLKQAQ